MKREACKFFSGAFAAMAWAHVAYALAVSGGVLKEPVFLGRKWPVGYALTEAAVYSSISAALGYAGWIAEPPEQQQQPRLSPAEGQSGAPVRAAESVAH